jgi:hypothetical protein
MPKGPRAYPVARRLRRSLINDHPVWEGRRILPSKNFNINNHLIGVRDLQRHAQLRKPWNKAFGVGPLKDYEEMLHSRAGMMGSRLDEICGEGAGRVDLTEWTSFFAYVQRSPARYDRSPRY